MNKKTGVNPFAIMLVLLTMKVCSIGCIIEEKRHRNISAAGSPDIALSAAKRSRIVDMRIKRTRKKRKKAV